MLNQGRTKNGWIAYGWDNGKPVVVAKDEQAYELLCQKVRNILKKETKRAEHNRLLKGSRKRNP